MLKPIMTIEHWAVVRSVIAPTYDELQPGHHLTGLIFAHAKQRQKALVYTSPIVKLDFSQGIVETHNGMYRLGEPSDEYKSWCNKRRVAAA